MPLWPVVEPDVDGRMSGGGRGESELVGLGSGTIEVVGAEPVAGELPNTLNELTQLAFSIGRVRVCGLVDGPLA